MKKTDVIAFYGTQTAVARAAGVTVSAVSQWPELIPERMAWRLQYATTGRLRVNPQDYHAPSEARTRLNP